MDGIMKIVKSLKEYDLLIEHASEIIENEAKEQEGRFLGTVLGTLGTSLLENR